jgi:uncharacterized protein YndB with AHSA1/START domain
MAIDFETQVRIGRPIDAVFAMLADVERWPAWLIATGIRRVQIVGGGPPAAGKKLVIEQSAAGRAATIDAEVTALDPPSRFAVKGRDPEGITTEIEARLSADGPITILAWRLRIGLPLRFRMFEGLAAPQVRRAAALDLEALKQRLESVATD